ncbi:MAG TPA: NTP transferase domain-containing protein [Trueperaceae bacterium]|nr:NTP transferase domain-containing protein [Trueperaceae bacterium]
MTSGGVEFDAVVLAAGKGTRMRSELHKVLHEAAGLPLLEHVLRALRPVQPSSTVVIVGHGSAAIRRRFAGTGVQFAEQTELLGTGHALLQAAPVLSGTGRPVLVLNGDGPLITPETIAALAAAQGNLHGMTLVTSEVTEPRGLGRIVRTASGDVAGIVEEKDATADQLLITEINPGIYAFDASVFERALQLGNDNNSGEYYITDLLSQYRAAGLPVRGLPASSEAEVLAVNDKVELARADRALRDRIRRRWLVAGVTMCAPEQVFIDEDVVIGRDVTLEPGVHLRGATSIGDGASVGPGAVLVDCVVGAGTVVAPHTVARGETLLGTPVASTP